MHRKLELTENGVIVKTFHSDHNDLNNSGLNEDIMAFISSIEAKKQVEVFLEPNARKIGERIGKNIRGALMANPEKSHQVGYAIGQKLSLKA